MKYFNFSNKSIITRSRFHGLTTQEGEQIASYIRTLRVPNPGRPWNPPYQPGPGSDKKPISEWAAGAGLPWVLDNDARALPFLLDAHRQQLGSTVDVFESSADFRGLVGQIHSDVFRPDGNLNPREIPIALELPHWSQWLPRIHPKDAWGSAFVRSGFAAMYEGAPEDEKSAGHNISMRRLLAATETSARNIRTVGPAFDRWSHARWKFLGRYIHANTVWSTELADKVILLSYGNC